MATPDPVEFGSRIAQAYATEGAAVSLGWGMLGGAVVADAAVQIPASMCNRHGLIAGATGTGKTKTLQLVAEQLSAMGVSVFVADVKGDLSGLLKPGEPNDKITARASELGIEWTPRGHPVSFLSLGGLGPGVPVRAAVSSFGPQLLGKVLGANETQASSLSLVFDYADKAGLALVDLDDLRAVLQFLTSDDGRAELQGIGGLSSQTAGVLLRKIIELDQQGAEAFFGEPELDTADLIQTTVDGRGVISCLELSAVQDRPRLFSTFLMWLLADLFQTLPEIGDADKPKLCFFFDEAHLLFEDAPKEFVAQVAQTVRLIRSKGVGVFFVTQLPDDVPADVLAQLGNRVQHALRAFTPRDAKALKAAVTTYPRTSDYDLEEDLTQLGIGEAMITILSERGAPTPVVWTRMQPPSSLMAPISADELDATARASALWPKYSEEIDPESAREKLTAKLQASASDAPAAPKQAGAAKKAGAAKRAKTKPKGKGRAKDTPADDGNAVTDFLKSREGRATVNNVVRGAMGVLKGFMK
jgi:DNA helicase HerA-like ATPase